MFGVCRGCAAKDQTIAVLQEQIEWFRLHAGTPVLRTAPNTDKASVPWETVDVPWVSEEEQDIEAMQKAGLLSAEAARSALEQIGAFSTDVDFS